MLRHLNREVKNGKFVLYNKITTGKDIVDIYITFSQNNLNIFK